MSKIKPAILAVIVAGLAAWVLAPATSHMQQASLVTPGQVNVHELMSVSQNLPVHNYEAY